MTLRRNLFVAVTFAGGVSVGLLLTRAFQDRTTPPPSAWPRVVAYELDVDLTVPGRFGGSVRVTFEDVPEGPLHFLLNRSLTIERAAVDGRAAVVSHQHRMPGRFHSEARVVEVTIAPPPGEGPVRLDLDYQGEAAEGTRGSDWRGILFVGGEEARMCEQTVFYPQVPVDTEGPAIERAPFRLNVVAPAPWEVFAPLPPLVVEPDANGRRWRFAGERAQVLSILAGERQRRVVRVAGTEVITLLREEHAGLADAFARESGAALQHYAARFGPIDAGSLCVFEMCCRSDSSYNWTSDGVMAMDRHALGSEVPVKTLAHEVAHLWWGQAVSATGAGERFLIEGMAEFSAWTYLEDTGQSDLARGAISNALRDVAERTRAGESDALEQVGFDHEHYVDLAYGKGAVVLRLLRGQLLPGQFDRALGQLITHCEGRPVTRDDFLQALRETTGQAELRVPWLAGSGDLELELSGLEATEGARVCQLTIRSTPATTLCTLDPRGTPVGVLLGGAGWSSRHSVLLTGEETLVALGTGGRVVTYARLDPDGVWSRASRLRTVVLDGAKLVSRDPPGGGPVPWGGQTIRLLFDRALAPVALETLRALQAGAGGADVDGLSIHGVEQAEDGRTLELRTEPWRPGRRYRVLLTSLVDPGGTPLAETTFEFETEASSDATSPRVIASVPASGATLPPGPTWISVTFDEVMQRGQGFPGSVVRANQRRGLEFPDFADFGTWDESCRTITWHIPEPAPGTTYCLPLVGGRFRDLSGNGAADFELTFTVAKGGPP